MDKLKSQYNDNLKELFKLKNQLSNSKNETEIESLKAQIVSIQAEMKELLNKIKEYSPEEVNKGFNLNNKSTQIQEVKQTNTNNNISLLSTNWNLAEKLSRSTIIPDTFKNKPENVVIAIGLSQKMDLDPFTIMQNLNIIKGKTSWSGSFCRTLIERSGKYYGLKLVFIGTKGTDSYGCYMEAKDKETGETIKGPEVNMKMARAENWTSNTKWINMPELMLSYRATSFFARVYVPEALNGFQTTGEIEDILNDYNNNQKREMKDVL